MKRIYQNRRSVFTKVSPVFVTEGSRSLPPNRFVGNSLRVDCLKKQKKKKKLIAAPIGQELLDSAKEYTQNTTLHGLKYVGADDLHLIERLFWTAAFAFGLLAASYFITILYKRWDNDPMIISLSPSATPLTSIPFPSITVCSMNGARKFLADNISESRSNDSHTLFEKQMLRVVCGEKMTDDRSPIDVVDTDWIKIKRFLIRISPPCREMITSCRWRSRHWACEELFDSKLTDDGMCCTFNQAENKYIYRKLLFLKRSNVSHSHSKIDWTPESGYPEGASENAYPWRAFGTGISMGLSVVLDAALHDYYCSTTASAGFKFLLHSPIERPTISDFAYLLMPGFETRVEIWPKITSSTLNLVNIPQAKRQCHFSTERQLKYFRTYTQINCELECQSNFTFHHCQCVPFYLPSDSKTKSCGTKDIECVIRVKEIFNHRMKAGTTGKNFELFENCSCFPGCMQIHYNKQMSMSKLEGSFMVRERFLSGKNLSYYQRNMAVVHFFFTENSVTKYVKGEIFGFTDFLSNIGGLLGLFLGFSFMSAAEIIYFMSLRIFCSWNRKKPFARRKKPKSAKFPFKQ